MLKSMPRVWIIIIAEVAHYTAKRRRQERFWKRRTQKATCVRKPTASLNQFFRYLLPTIWRLSWRNLPRRSQRCQRWRSRSRRNWRISIRLVSKFQLFTKSGWFCKWPPKFEIFPRNRIIRRDLRQVFG